MARWDDVYSSYKKKAEAGGWTIMMENMQREVIVLIGEKNGKRLMLNVASEDGKTMVNITVGEE